MMWVFEKLYIVLPTKCSIELLVKLKKYIKHKIWDVPQVQQPGNVQQPSAGTVSSSRLVRTPERPSVASLEHP